VHGGSFLKRIFECLGLAIPYSPADSKTFHGHRKERNQLSVLILKGYQYGIQRKKSLK